MTQEDRGLHIEADDGRPSRHLSLLNSALDLTLAAVALHGWQVVLLGERSKRPIGKIWHITRDLDTIRRHNGNRGLVCGPKSTAAVLDFDDRATGEEMQAELGPVVAWARSGSGRGDHCYFQYQPGLPAKITWRGVKVGEVQRGGIGPDGQPVLQQVVLPPAIHPGDPKKGIPSGGIYRWLVDPRDPLPTLPEAWRAYLTASAPPSLPKVDTTGAPPEDDPPEWIPVRDRWGVPEDEWDGPPADELLQHALQQPGAQRRRSGVKFQCPGCHAEGHDRHMDNALVRLDGRWGCALNSEHRHAIAVALRVVPAGVSATVAAIAGVPTSWVRGY